MDYTGIRKIIADLFLQRGKFMFSSAGISHQVTSSKKFVSLSPVAEHFDDFRSNKLLRPADALGTLMTAIST